MAGVTFIWSQFEHLKGPEIFVLCAGIFAFSILAVNGWGNFLNKIKPKNVKKYINKKFRNETVEIDGCEFYECHFENVTLNYRGGEFKFDNCFFSHQSLNV
jgi:hypothetical protein